MPEALPRTMTKAEWRKVDRWRRIVSRRLRQEVERAAFNLIMWGTSHPDCSMKLDTGYDECEDCDEESADMEDCQSCWAGPLCSACFDAHECAALREAEVGGP